VPLSAAAYRLIGWFSVTRFDRVVHPILYRWSGGRGILGRILGCEMVLLTTTGRRSGLARTVALFAFAVSEPAGSWAVVGSRGGSGQIPAWFWNLGASPHASLQVHDRTRPVRAREVLGDEYERLFDQAATGYPGYRVYRARAAHHIPIVVLEPATTVAATPVPATPATSASVAAPAPSDPGLIAPS
jgi:deazaflavin-dependent oxidoreductase (nitroreductase family)